MKLSDERRLDLLRSISEFYDSQFDEKIGDLKTGLLLDFFLKELGPPVYNQAIRDAHAFMQAKLSDIEGEVFYPD